jgi:hypothetical protein
MAQRLISALGLLVAGAFVSATPAFTQSLIVPAKGTVCPSGTHYVGAGYCQAQSSQGYVEADGTVCPSGTHYAGAGYCEAEGSQRYVRANGVVCPAATRYAGARYCQTY